MISTKSVPTQVTVVGAFSDRAAADRAVGALESAGFTRDAIGVASRNPETGAADIENADGTHTDETKADEGALAGAAIGAGVGGLVGVGVLAGVIPVIGPAIAIGTLGTILANAAGGAAIAGLTGALVGWGVSDSDAQHYDDEFQAGRTIVTVRADDRAPEARQILDDNGAARAPMAAAKRK